MRPQVGDEVKIKKEIIASGQYVSLDGKKLKVMKVALGNIISSGATYNVAVSDGTGIYVVIIDKNGCINGDVVFEKWVYGTTGVKLVPTAVPVKKEQPLTEDDRCKKCGTMGRVTGLSCRCPSCDEIIWGI